MSSRHTLAAGDLPGSIRSRFPIFDSKVYLNSRAQELRGALVLVDADQAIGAIPIDVRVLDADFLVAGVLKYLLGSAGPAFLHCRREHLESTP